MSFIIYWKTKMKNDKILLFSPFDKQKIQRKQE